MLCIFSKLMKAIDRSNTWFRQFKLEVFYCVFDSYNLSINVRACTKHATQISSLYSYVYIPIVSNFLQG